MLKFVITIALIFNITESLYTQDGWVWQNPLPQGNDMSNLQFVNSNTAYAMCFNSVMKSTNAGSNWSIHYTNHSQNNTSLHFINETTGFIVSDTGMVLKTVNGGVNWSTIYNFNQMKFNKVYFNDLNTGYLLRYNDIYGYKGTSFYRTSNGGLNWSVLINDTTFALRDIKFLNLQTGYMGGSGGPTPFNNEHAKIFKTTNFGLSWDSINTNFSCRVIGIELKNNNFFVFGYKSGLSNRGMFLSTNEGTNWISTEITRDVRDFSFVDPSNMYVSATNSGVFLYKSTNNGVNWSNIGSDIKSYEIEFINPTTGISIGGNGQVYKTSNSGINWNSQITQLAEFIWEVDFPTANTGFAADQGGLLKTTNGGINWIRILNRGLYKMDFIDQSTGYCSGTDSMYKTTDGGASWTIINFGSYSQINDMCFINSNTGFILDSPAKKTTNGGINWTNIYSYRGYPQSIYFYNENLGFIGEDDFNLGWGVSRTTNGGLNWDFQTFPTVTNYIYDFFFVNSTTGFFTTNGQIFKTINSGNNWNRVFEITPYFEIWSIQFLNENVGYATYGGQILKTTDAGNTWKVHNSITNYAFLDVFFTDVNTGYFVGVGGVILKTTNGGGSPISIEPISSSIPDDYMLYQNYPNPFNPTTKIKFSIPSGINSKNGLTSLKIFDVLGRELENPVNEILTPGEYEIEWNAGNYPSGIYFYTLKNGNFSKTGKMILIK